MIRRPIRFWAAAILGAVAAACAPQPRPGTVLDEAMRAHLQATDLVKPTDDYFHDMDFNLVNGVVPRFSAAQWEGRNMWIVWTGGDDRLWDVLTVNSLGSFDLLKTISSHPLSAYDAASAYCGDYGRHNRFKCLGLVNEPCYQEATGPDPNHFGLWLDVRDPNCPKDPFADATRYPGAKIGARGTTIPVGSYYGEPTGVIGLRLFPNPAFDEKARRKWNADRFYNDPGYYYDRNLVRPYRVGMSCGFCHVGPNPIKPPADPENPKWENLSSNVGAQYFWWDRIFDWKGTRNENSVFNQVLHVSRPGTLDTSLVSTDNIANPRSMNAVYEFPARLELAKRLHKELLEGGERDNKQFNDFVPPNDPLAQFFVWPGTVWTARVLKDGSDSVGTLGALNRVYMNIGLFSEEWLLHFRALVGGQAISPIPIATAEKNSIYWRATELQTPKMAAFFLASTDPHHLSDAPGGSTYLTDGAATVQHGKEVFADRCARCHNSKPMPMPPGLDFTNAIGPDYLKAWDQYWAYTKTPEFKTQVRAQVLAPDFLTHNYLSTELRVPVTLLGTNVCSPLATNAIKDNVWDNFSSSTYKSLPPVGKVKIRSPITGQEMDYDLPGGGRGYTRPASLVSLWSTAPFLQNNTVGPFYWNPSVESRMKSFQESIEQMLWPERREKDALFSAQGPGIGIIDRLTVDSYLNVPASYIPDPLRGLVGAGHRLFPFITSDDYTIKIGPFPKGMPVDLIANLDITGSDLPASERGAHQKAVLRLLEKSKEALKPGVDLGTVLGSTVQEMFDLAKCKDFVVNKGHYFGTDYFTEEPGLSDQDKLALIAFLKTF